MKTKTIILLSIALTCFFSSCKKENTARDYSTYENKVKPNSLSQVTDAMILRLYDSVKVERDTFYYVLNALYPGLQSQMQTDAETMTHETDSAAAGILLQNFYNNYHAQVLDAWKIAHIDSQKIIDKYTGIMGGIPIHVGEFGTMSIVETVTAESVPYSFPDNVETYGAMRREKSGGCGVLADYILAGFYTDDYVRMKVNAVEAGGCNADVHFFDTIVPANKVYKYLVATFRQPNSFLGNRSVSVGGVSCAESTVSLHIEANGVEINRRDVAQVITVAPICWYSEAQVDVPVNGSIGITDADKLSNKNYKVYRRMHCKTGAGGLLSLAVAWNYLFSGNLKFFLAK
ncbi:MAG: hypothetical protein NTY88_06915 [Bacteroidetes bacterium]|nr:hypothetical protein [Bacteroidota bacterium]